MTIVLDALMCPLSHLREKRHRTLHARRPVTATLCAAQMRFRATSTQLENSNFQVKKPQFVGFRAYTHVPYDDELRSCFLLSYLAS